MDGIEATRRIVAVGSTTRILILTTFDLDEYVHDAIRAGASGFLLKDVRPARTRRRNPPRRQRQRAPHPDRSRTPAGTLRDAQAVGVGRHRSSQRSPSAKREILRLIAKGLSNAELAARLVLSEATVKTHISSVLRKLGVRDRVQAVIAAYDSGLVEPRHDPRNSS